MKHKFSSMWRVAIALVMVLSLSLVMAVPVAADVSSATVTVDPTTTGTDAEYKIEFATTVALASTDTITITFPYDTTVPATTDFNGKVTVNDTTCPDGTVVSTALVVVIDVPANILAGAVTVVIDETAGVLNPSDAGVYALKVQTSVENIDVTSKGYAIGDPVRIVDSVDTPLDTVVNGTSFHVHVTDGAPVKMWNTHPAMVDTLKVTVNTYDGAATLGTPTSTATYTATETDKDTSEFWTDAISTATLNVRPGYKLEVYPSGTTATGEAFIRAEISFDKSYYDVNETMTITIKDESLNDSKTAADEFEGNVLAGGETETFTETGVDTGVFTWSGTPSDNGFAPGDPMTATYNAATTGGVAIDATAAVRMSSTSSVKFDQGTYAVDASSATITVTDADKAGGGVIIGADCLVVENLATGDSVSFDSIDEVASGDFEATVTFGTDTDELAINDGDTLKATYTDPATPEDVSTAIAAVGYTVFLYNADGTLDDSYTTIQEAVDDADTSGETIKVSGTYNSVDDANYSSGDDPGFPIVIDKANLTVESISGAASTIIDASEAEGIYITANDVTFDGFTVLDAADPHKAVHITGDDVTVKGCTITSSESLAVHGIFVGGDATGATISGNVIENVTGSGGSQITLSGVSDCEVLDNVLTDSFIWLSGVSTSTITGNNVSGVDGAGCITMQGSTDILIQDNSLSNGAGGIIVSLGDVGGLQILGNDITNNTLSNGEGIAIGSGVIWGTSAIKFNNITGNTVGIANYMSTETVDATHNWWGTSDPSADTFSGLVTYEPCLGASVSAAAFAVSDVTTGVTSLNAKATVGVQISGLPTDVAKDNAIGAALYTANPKGTFTALENGFVDVYVDYGVDTPGPTDEVLLKFSPAGIDENSVIYAWNELEGVWEECTLQGFSSFGGYTWMKVHSELHTTAPTVPTIESLVGLPFAISTEEAPPSTIQLYEGANPIHYTGATMDLPGALTNISEITEIIWQKDVSTGGEWWLYFVEWGTGEITQMENGRVYIIVVSEDCIWELAQ